MMYETLDEMRERYVHIGEQRGEKKNAREVALRLMKAGLFTDEEIAELSGFPLTEFKKLKAEAAA